MNVRHIEYGTFEKGQDARSHPYVGRDEPLDCLLQFEGNLATGTAPWMAVQMLNQNAQRERVHGMDGTCGDSIPTILQPFGAAIFVGSDGTLQMTEQWSGTATSITNANGRQQGVVE